MSNNRYTADILADALFRAGEPTDGTSDYALEAVTTLNRVYQEICNGGCELDPATVEDWVWLRQPRPGVLNLAAPITTITATVTHDSTAVTLSTGPAFTVADWFFKVADEPPIFRILTHTAASTSVTLDAAYTGVSGAGLNCTLFKLEYNLATDVLRLLKPMRCFAASGYNNSQYKVHGTELDVMEESYPLVFTQMGIPSLFAPVGETTQGTQRVRFNACGGPAATTLIRVEYDYLFRPADLTDPGTTEEPVVPLQWRGVLTHTLLAYLLGVKQDQRAPAVFQIAQAGYRGMLEENRKKLRSTTGNAMRLLPRDGNRRFWGPLRTESGMIIG